MQHGLFIISVVDKSLRLYDHRRFIRDPSLADINFNFLYDNILELHCEVLVFAVLQ